MSHRDDIPDDQSFEEYLKRGSDLSQRYKASAQDGVPPDLDKKILMQAREAVSDKQVITHRSWWIRWNKPLALAASLMLAFTVIFRAGYQSIDKLSAPETPAIARQETITASKMNAAPKLADAAAASEEKSVTANQLKAVPSQKDNQQDKFETLAKTQSGSNHEVTQPPAPLPPVQIPLPAPVAAPSIASSPAVNEPALIAGNAGVVSSKAATRREAEAVVDSVTAKDVGQLPDRAVSESLQRIPGVEIKQEVRNAAKKKQDATDPEQLLQQIRDLRKQGRKKQADKAWKQFQKDFPDYFVAEDDVVRGATK